MIQRYQSRISGPFLDRIDLQVDLQREQQYIVAERVSGSAESSDIIRARVVAARDRQIRRQQVSNAMLTPQALSRHADADDAARSLMRDASQRLGLSLRAQHRLLRVARTIADMDDSAAVMESHLAESLSYRRSPLFHQHSAHA